MCRVGRKTLLTQSACYKLSVISRLYSTDCSYKLSLSVLVVQWLGVGLVIERSLV